jgi:hypothetical protein
VLTHHVGEGQGRVLCAAGVAWLPLAQLGPFGARCPAAPYEIESPESGKSKSQVALNVPLFPQAMGKANAAGGVWAASKWALRPYFRALRLNLVAEFFLVELD